MQYLAWRVFCELNRKIEISFLLVGHTKFAPDFFHNPRIVADFPVLDHIYVHGMTYIEHYTSTYLNFLS